MFETTSAINGWTYEWSSNAAEFDSAACSFHTHLSASARAVWLWTPFCITTSGVTQAARSRLQTSRGWKSTSEKGMANCNLLCSSLFYILFDLNEPPENEWVRDSSRLNFDNFSPTRLYFVCSFHLPLRFHEVRRCRTCWMPRIVKLPWVPSSNVGEDGLDNCWKEPWKDAGQARLRSSTMNWARLRTTKPCAIYV